MTKSIMFCFLLAILSTSSFQLCAQGEKSRQAYHARSPLGVAWGFDYGQASEPAVFMPGLRKLGVSSTKIYLFWHGVEPSKGNYDWKSVDIFVNQLQLEDDPLIAVYSSSTWATKVSTTLLPASPAKSLDDYYKFIYTLVKHCKGKVKFWQNDCEPTNPVFWNGTEAEFVAQLRVFHKAVKDADPEAQVVLGGFDGLFNPPGMREFPNQNENLAFYERTIVNAAPYYDLFDIRLYADPYTIPYRVNYFKDKLAKLNTQKKIICTEYNGPGFFEFPENRKFYPLMGRWNQAIAGQDTTAYFKIQNEVKSMHDSLHLQPPQTQLFLAKDGTTMATKYFRLQARDIVIRNLLAFSAGIIKTLFWDLWHNTDNPYDLMTVIYGKNKLMEFKEGKIGSHYPLAEAFERMVKKLGDVERVERLPLPELENLYFFEVTRFDKSKVFVCWEKRDVFSGEDQIATRYVLPWKSRKAVVSDIFGASVKSEIDQHGLHLSLSGTPFFIQP